MSKVSDERKRVKSLLSHGGEFTGELRFLPRGVWFRTINKSGKVGKAVYRKTMDSCGTWDPSEKKYLCDVAHDMLGAGKYLKPGQAVTTDIWSEDDPYIHRNFGD